MHVEHTGAEVTLRKRERKRCTTASLRGVGVRLSYHNWKLAACVESLKSIPMETVTEASGSSRSERGRGGEKEA